jgi:hypothetical protein
MMNSQNDKEGTWHVRAAIIGGIFAVLAACIGGFFLILNTMVENGVIVFGMSNPSSLPTATVSVFQESTQDPSNIAITSTSIFSDIPTITPEPTIAVKAEDVTQYIKGEENEISSILKWWQEVDPSGTDGVITSSTIANHQCFGLTWNTSEYGYRKIVVFQGQISVKFLDGGWHTTVCVPNNVIISAEDVGKIQADWLGKRYVDVNAQPWVVIIK